MRIVPYFSALVKAPGMQYKCPQHPTEKEHPLGKNVGWLGASGTLHGFVWDALTFPTKDAMLTAVSAAGGELLDYFHVTE